MKFVLADVDGFERWYTDKEAGLRTNLLARFFLEVRNELTKRGFNPLASFSSASSPANDHTIQYYFLYWYGDSPKGLPDLDVVTACEQHLTTLAQLVYECYRDFGKVIDPEQYYTIENLSALGLSVEDVMERELGFPRNWAQGFDPEQVLRQIRENEPKPLIDDLLLKYLGHNRFGL